MTRIGGSTFLFVALAGLWSAEARAQWEGSTCGTIGSYTPARFTNGNPGDVALIGNSGSAAASALAPIAGVLGMTYFHVSMVHDNAGGMTETYWDGIAPPSSDTTGEPDVCSRVISPFFLARLSPGTIAPYPDVVPANLVKGMRTTACYPPADNYHFNSFIHDDVPGGSCEKMLVDECDLPMVEYNTYVGCFADEANRDMPYVAFGGSVPLSVEACVSACAGAGYEYAGAQFGTQCFCGNSYGKYGGASDCNVPCTDQTAHAPYSTPGGQEICGGAWANSVYKAIGGDRPVYNGSQFFAAVNAVWQDAYNECIGVINASWPWEGIGCGGTGTNVACQRAAWQFVNEVAYKAHPVQVDAGWDDGWSDFNNLGNWVQSWELPPPGYNTTSGTMLGAGKMNEETMPNGALCPGACNNGGCNNAPIGCSAYEPSTWVANVPDNIYRSATRINPSNSSSLPGYVVGGTIAPGYWTYTTYPPCDAPYYCFSNVCQNE
jgi:hypothetical protein